MAKYRQDRDELRGHLVEQVQFLRNSAASYDIGFEGEAKRLALVVRVLVHDTKASKSLLHQLSLKGSLRLFDTATPLLEDNLLPHLGLVSIKVEAPPGKDGSAEFVVFGPDLADSPAPPGLPRAKVTFVPRILVPCELRRSDPRQPRRTYFTDWWSQVVLTDKQRNRFSREDLVLTLANKDGGGHVDPQLDEQWANLTRFNSLGWKIVGERARHPPDNSVVAASVRQIAHELLGSLEEAFPELCRP